MAYETASASGVADLLDKLRVFATANGWTQNYFGARTSGAGTALQLTKGTQYVTFIADTGAGLSTDPGPFFGAYSHNVYSAGNGTENQAQGSTKLYSNAMSGPFVAYHFMTGAERGCDYLYVVIETSSGVYKHTGVGKLVSLGALNTGMFAYACRWSYSTSSDTINTPNSTQHGVPWDSRCTSVGQSTQVRADSDGVVPRWYDANSGGSFGNRMGGGVRDAGPASAGSVRGTLQTAGLCAASSITGRTVLLPPWMYGERTSNLGSPLGYPPHLRWVRLDYLSPGDVLTIGSDQWKVFPVIRKDGGVGQVNSGKYGYAYKVN
jgi:hypothetical protein